jgi:hypothetical protein
MEPDERQFLTLLILPAILSQRQAAWYLGLKWHNIPRLVESGILSPLGRPKANSLKFFALADLERLRSDPKKLSRAIDSVQNGWKRKNRERPNTPSSRPSPPSGHVNGRLQNGDFDTNGLDGTDS